MRIRSVAVLVAATVLSSTLFTVPALAAAPLPPVTDPIVLPRGPDGTRTDKSLVIGLDGAMLDRIRAADTPNMDALMASGTSALAYRYGSGSGAGLDPAASTVSGPGWSTVLTGVWPDKHGVRDNSFAGKQYGRYPDYLSRAETVDPSVSTFAIADWDPIAGDTAGGPIIAGTVDVRIGLRADTDGVGYEVDDARIAEAASRYLAEQDPDLAFVYFGATDAAGHSAGNGSAAYRDSLQRDDTKIGMLLAAIRSRPTYAQESWQIIVTNDHGHTAAGGHGGNTLEERQQFLIASGGGIPAGPQRADLNVTDVVPTVYRHAGLDVDPAWGLDGTAVDQAVADDFDTRRGALQPRLDETGIPAGLLGHTPGAPAGWSVDNSALPTGGVREWRGWTFTTNEFWSSAQRSQGRENFVRGRDVIAVADSDEWDDAAHGSGRFDSTLVSPSYPVDGPSTLEFQTFYQHEGAQTAEVSVSYDGAPAVRVASFTGNTSGLQRITLAAADSVRVRFRYTGTNNWYWAVDQVRVTATG